MIHKEIMGWHHGYQLHGPVGGLYSFEFVEGDDDNNNNIICKKHLSNITVSNGIVWTKDGKTMYYIDTPTMNADAFDFDGKMVQYQIVELYIHFLVIMMTMAMMMVAMIYNNHHLQQQQQH